MFMRAGWKEIFREAGLHDYPQLWFYKWIGHDKKAPFPDACSFRPITAPGSRRRLIV